jgi:hypothetical protein
LFFLIENIPTGSIENQDRRNSTLLNKLVQEAIKEALGFVWIKQGDERVVKVGVRHPWTETIGWMKTSFRCSQDSIMKRKSKKDAKSKGRGAKHPMERFPCHGTLELACDTFSKRPQCLVRLKHHMEHPPRNAHETPGEIIDYIRTSWEPSSYEQWEQIHRAAKKGDIKTSVENLIQKAVHYWWSQSMVKKVNRDPDPWVSLQLYLQEQPNVNDRISSTIILR